RCAAREDRRRQPVGGAPKSRRVPGQPAVSARLALIGAPGAGKSTVGALLADRWGATLVDTDTEYERTHGHGVAEAVIDDEATFRVAEESVVLAALETDGAVVAVGSGAPMSQPVREALTSVPTVWLEVGLVAAA